MHYNAALDADAEFGSLLDRAAWYASDRGDALRAVTLWRMLESPDERDVGAVEDALRVAPAKRGRNEPCWCGSGRKQKVCHGDAPEPVPLPDRVPWLAAKAAAYLFRRGGEAEIDLFDLAIARTEEPNASADIVAAARDPFVVDVALTELGWFKRFLEDRGPLLPDDEAQLAQQWVPVARTVYEVEQVREDGIVVRDLRSGDRVEVRARASGAHTEVGRRLCARAVPDGATHQFVGAVFTVGPDDVERVVDLCANRDAFGLCEAFAGSVFR
jgi:hypothetical protein